MAVGMKPGFITGANAKLKTSGKTLAYATDVSYDLTTITIPIEVMGRYEVVSNEPLAHGIAGAFSIVRYTSAAASSAIPDVSSTGNASGNIAAGGGNFHDHFNPSKLMGSQTFDLEIFQKIATGDTASTVHVFTVRDVRLTRKGATLSKRGILVDQYAFVGILGDDAEDPSATTATSNTPGTQTDLT